MQQCERLRKYNRWRRGDKRLKMPDPKELGELIDGVADRLEVLEREHMEFFDRWHDERRKRESLERAILQHQADVRYATQGAALSLADDTLYKALKVGAGGTATEGHNA